MIPIKITINVENPVSFDTIPLILNNEYIIVQAI